MRAIVALCLMMLSALALGQSESQAYLMCGTSACAPNINAVYFVGQVSGIDDLNVGGDYFNVSFASTPPVSPFVVSSTSAAPHQPLTGIDAGDAIAAFYGALQPPYGGYDFPGDPGPAFITAFGPAGSLSSQYFGSTELFDVVQTAVGGGYGSVGEVGISGFTSGNTPIVSPSQAYYTTWTAIAAPEIDPSLASTGCALLIGGLVVLRGRRGLRT